MTYQLVATCLFGLEKLLGEELDALGLKRTLTMDGRVFFEGEEKEIPRANIFLRTAERVYILLGSFGAHSFTELFDGTKALPWEAFIGKYDAFPVTGHAIKSKLFSLPDCQKIVKKAVVDRLSSHHGAKWFSENSGVKYGIEFFIFKDIAYLMIDTSGVALHKRGYRPASGIAPIRETLAAAIALTARPREDTLFWDPFCGSGTLVIEAAMIATGRAAGMNRTFAAESFPQFGKKLWAEARECAMDSVKRDSHFEAFASDIDENMLDLVYENASRAGVEEHLNIFEADARTIKKPDRRGTLLCNPPYGERMMDKKEIDELYAAIGKTFATFSPWQMYVITSCEYFEKLFGRRADKTKRLYNGMIPCTLYEYFKPR